jgi:hypothetical protein
MGKEKFLTGSGMGDLSQGQLVARTGPEQNWGLCGDRSTIKITYIQSVPYRKHRFHYKDQSVTSALPAGSQ